MKKCSKCNRTKRLGLFYRKGEGCRAACISCSKELYDNKEHAEACRLRYHTNKNGHGAHAIVKKALEDGTLVRQGCNVCGKAKSEAHHEDYTKPLDVIWLCRSHHQKRHYELDRLGIDLHRNYKEAIAA